MRAAERASNGPTVPAAAAAEEAIGEAKDISGYKPESEFIKTMQERGFLHSCTNIEELDKKMKAGVVTAYLGFDATASSLHLGGAWRVGAAAPLGTRGARGLGGAGHTSSEASHAGAAGKRRHAQPGPPARPEGGEEGA